MMHSRSVTSLVAIAIFSSALSAQSGGNVSVTAPLEQQYAGALTVLHDKVVALATAIPAEKYSWRPSSEVRSVSQVLMHVVVELFHMCPISVGERPPADMGPTQESMRKLEEITDKTAVLAQLEQAWTHCRSALDRIDPRKLVPDSLPAQMGFPRVVLLISGDQHEHLGQLIAYARSLGVKPPWSN
jgi:uncharacterized damage-inducible protein DinB